MDDAVEALIAVMESSEREIAQAQARQLAAIEALRVARAGTPLAELVSCEVAFALMISDGAARGRLALAQCMSNRFPATLAALARGDIDLYKASSIVEIADRVVDDAGAALVEAAGLAVAAERSGTALRVVLRRALARVDPRGTEERHAASLPDRRVVRTPLDDGMSQIWALLPADGAETVWSAVDGLARAMDGPEESRTLDQLRADSLVELCRRVLGYGGVEDLPLGKRRGAVPNVNVTVGADTLLGVSDAPGWLAGYGPIPASMARRTAKDATWRRLLTDPVSGALLDRSETTYRQGAVLSSAVIARDQSCRFPTCTWPAEGCDLDHTEPFPAGFTAWGNLGALHRRHHRAKQAGFRLAQRCPGVFEWISPAGRRRVVYAPALAEPRPLPDVLRLRRQPDTPAPP